MRAMGTSMIKVAFGVCLGLIMFVLFMGVCVPAGCACAQAGFLFGTAGLLSRTGPQEVEDVAAIERVEENKQRLPTESAGAMQTQADTEEGSTISGEPDDSTKDPAATRPDTSQRSNPTVDPKEPLPPTSNVVQETSEKYSELLQRVTRNCPEDLMSSAYRDELLATATQLSREGADRRTVWGTLRKKVLADGMNIDQDSRKCLAALTSLGEELGSTTAGSD